MRLTKIDVAEAHVISAVRLHFQCGPPASVYLLAGSAREILTTLAEKAGTRAMIHLVADHSGRQLEDLYQAVHEHVRFLKHANRDPQAVLEDLTEDNIDGLLFIACGDLIRIATARPIEALIFVVWYLAIHYSKDAGTSLRAPPFIRDYIKYFSGILSLPRKEHLRLGCRKLQEATDDPNLLMELQREVVQFLCATS